MADIFVSYSSDDREWAFWIARELKKLGHVPRVHEWEIPAGGDIAAWMEERHDKADHILCVISEAYLRKGHASWERRAAQWAASGERPNFALPVFVADCKAPTLLAHVKRCDLFALTEDLARKRLSAFLAAPEEPTGALRFPGEAPVAAAPRSDAVQVAMSESARPATLPAAKPASAWGETLFPGLGAHPPRPTLTLRVGITGHRPKPAKLPKDSFGFVTERLGAVLAAVDSSLAAIARDRGDYSDEAHRVRLVSGLAEGADQMAVAAMPAAWALDAVLPFPRESYREDFKTSAAGDGGDVTQGFLDCLGKAAAVVELPDDPDVKSRRLTQQAAPEDYWRRRNAGYARLGGFLLRQIDLLVAVWDGKPEEGAGGTAEVVRAAIDAEIPVVWVHSLEDAFARMIEGFDDDGRARAPDVDCRNGPLAEAIDAIVSPPTRTEADETAREGPDVVERLRGFLAETWPKASHWLTYDLFKRWMDGKPLRFKIPAETLPGYIARWAPLGEDGPPVGLLRDHMASVLRPRFAWADALAVDYSHRYRTAYFNSYLLAATAVFIALVGIFGHDWFETPQSQLTFKALLVTIEIGVILTIVLVVRRGRRERWQEKWIEYRALAELLLNARFLAYLGEHGRAHRLGNLEPASSAWFLWYLRATIREIGLPDARLDTSYQRILLTAVDKHVIADQKIWHKANAAALHRMHQRLHRLTDLLFVLTFVPLIGFLVAWVVFAVLMVVDEGKDLAYFVGRLHSGDDSLERAWSDAAAPAGEKLGAWLLALKDYVIFFAALLPAVGAALAGIRETGDFDKVSERSIKTAAALQELQREVARARSTLTLDETGDILLSTARVLTEDLAAWQSVYGHKRLELPA